MERHVGPLAVLSFFILIPLLLIFVPMSEWGAVAIYLCVLTLLSLLLYQQGIKPVDPEFPAALFLLALFVKLLGSLVRYWTVVDLYNGAADAIHYDQQGQLVAQYLKAYDFSILSNYGFRGEGTTNLVFVTAFLYTIMPASMAGSFFFFAGLAFTGSVLFYRVVRVTWPEGNTKFYRLFIFFLPSILFWPSSLGKDAWLFFCSGLVVWGWVNFMQRSNQSGLILIGAGLFLIGIIRPHIAAFLALGMGAGYLLYNTEQRSVFRWLIGAIAIVGLAIYLVQAGADFLKLEEISLASTQELYTELQDNTTQGGSGYQTANIFTPSGAIWGVITALARPFPWEARNAQVLIASLETMGWLAFCWRQRRTFWTKVRNLRADPVTGFVLCYSLIMLLALTSLGNFGILARQRVMLLPLFWMLFV